MPHPTDHQAARSSIFAQHPVLTAFLVAIGSLAPHLFLDESLSIGFAALLISLIAGVYLGFAVVNGSTREQMIEFGVASLFLVAALLGLAIWPGAIAAAYLAHAGWDFAHHDRAHLSLVEIPRWYVPWCAIIDVLIGIGLILVWRAHGILSL